MGVPGVLPGGRSSSPTQAGHVKSVEQGGCGKRAPDSGRLAWQKAGGQAHPELLLQRV